MLWSSPAHAQTWHPRTSTPLLLLMLWGLAGCSQFNTRVSDVFERNQDRSAQAQDTARNLPPPLQVVVRDNHPRFTGRSLSVNEEQALPAALSRVTVRYPGRHSLLQVAELISRTVKIPVTVTPDALMEPSRFSPVGNTAAGATASGTRPQVDTGAQVQRQLQREANAGLVSQQGGGMLNLTDEEYQNSLELNYSGNLEGLLDLVAARTGLYWRFSAGVITFSRIDTQTFSIKAHPGTSKFSAEVNGTNGESSGGTMSVSAGAEFDFWAGLEEGVKSLISRSGRFVIDSRNGFVTVTDAIHNVRAVRKMVQRYNELTTRQIVLNVEVLQIQLDESKAIGIDWGAVSQRINSMSGAQVTLQGPASIIRSPGVGSVGLTLTGGAGQLNTGRFLINALETFGKVSTAYSVSVATTNRQPVPVGALNNLAYVKQASPASVVPTSGVATSGALIPGTVQTGFAMTLIPTILDSNRIMLQSSLTISLLKSLRTFTSGTASVQTPEVDSFTSMQRMSASPGDTLILLGYEHEGGDWSSADLSQGFPIPGYRSGTRKRVSTVVLVTPVLQGI